MLDLNLVCLIVLLILLDKLTFAEGLLLVLEQALPSRIETTIRKYMHLFMM